MVRVKEFAVVAATAFAAMGAAAAISSPPTNALVALKTFTVLPAHPVVVAATPKKFVISLPRESIAAAGMSASTATPPPATGPVMAVQRGSVVAAMIATASKAPALSAPPAVSADSLARVQTAAAKIDGPKPELRVAQLSDTAPFIDTDTSDLANSVALRVKDSVPSQLFPYFDVYLYVSKAASGPWAQHMFIFHKGADNHLVFEQSVSVSTGRERHEKYFTSTPTGLFELDPNRFDRNHRSHRWDNAPMPWAMFLDYTINNHLAGVALHSVIGHVQLLGQRASGGCVRLPPQTAELLFERFQAQEQGMVPSFAFNDTHSTTLTDGTLELGAGGQPVLTRGYKVLLIIQDYPGGQALVAEVS